MAITKQQFIERARARSERHGDYWDWIAALVALKPGIGIADRKHYNQKQWAALSDAKSKLTEAWE